MWSSLRISWVFIGLLNIFKFMIAVLLTFLLLPPNLITKATYNRRINLVTMEYMVLDGSMNIMVEKVAECWSQSWELPSWGRHWEWCGLLTSQSSLPVTFFYSTRILLQNASQKIPLTWDPEFKHVCLWEAFSFKLPDITHTLFSTGSWPYCDAK